MKRYLGFVVVLAALAVLTGCGEQSVDRADDSASQSEQDRPTDEPTNEPADPGDPVVVDIVSGSAVGRAPVAETATVISSDAMLDRYLRQFDSPSFLADLNAAVAAAEPEEGRALGLAVIEISCDEPPSAEVTQEGAKFFVTAGKVANPHQECFAPVTSVAVLDLPAQ
jgi:hypothetical protein